MSAKHREIHKHYLSPEWVKKLVDFSNNNPHLYRVIPANKYRMNTPYQILDGEEMRKHFPESLQIADEILRITEKFAGQKLKFIADDFRSFRIHRYQGGSEGLLWHIDGALYSAIITLENQNGSGIEMFPMWKSRFLALLVYPLYLFQPFFSLFRPERINGEPGDMVVMYGGRAVHRTVDDGPGGYRSVLALSFRAAEQKFSVRAWILSWLNVTVKAVMNKNGIQKDGY